MRPLVSHVANPPQFVSELIDTPNARWNKELIDDVFLAETVEQWLCGIFIHNKYLHTKGKKNNKVNQCRFEETIP